MVVRDRLLKARLIGEHAGGDGGGVAVAVMIEVVMANGVPQVSLMMAVLVLL